MTKQLKEIKEKEWKIQERGDLKAYHKLIEYKREITRDKKFASIDEGRIGERLECLEEFMRTSYDGIDL